MKNNRRRFLLDSGGGRELEYLCIEAVTPTAMTVGYTRTGTSTAINPNVNYSLDGSSWNQMTAGVNVSVPSGSKIYFKGINNTLGNGTNYISFNASEPFSVSGNTTSLLYGDDFTDELDSLTGTYTFISLFKNSRVVNASGLLLPINTLDRCYISMFSGCTSLTSAPELPATSLASSCY